MLTLHRILSMASTSAVSAEAIPTETAAEKVFAVPELAENIIIQLPFIWLLLCQRTSRTFKHAVDSTPSFRRKLFLLAARTKPATKAELAPFCTHTTHSGHHNPDPTFEYYIATTIHVSLSPAQPRKVRTLDLHFLVCTTTNWLEPGPASWRQMLLTQPPATDIEVNCSLEEALSGVGS